MGTTHLVFDRLYQLLSLRLSVIYSHITIKKVYSATSYVIITSLRWCSL